MSSLNHIQLRKRPEFLGNAVSTTNLKDLRSIRIFICKYLFIGQLPTILKISRPTKFNHQVGQVHEANGKTVQPQGPDGGPQLEGDDVAVQVHGTVAAV